MERIRSIVWALRTAWRINKVILVAVFACAVALSVLPAVSLAFNRQALAQLSDFIVTGAGSFQQALPVLLAYGVILALIGLSSRVNTEFISSIMDSRYTYGMQEHLMEVINRFDALELVRRNINEDFNYIIRQSNTLGRLVSGTCAIGAKTVSIVSLCVAAWALCRPVFFITLAYVALTFVLAAVFSKGTRFNYTKFRKAEVKAFYLRTMPMEANIAKEIRVYGCADGVVDSWNKAYAERLNMELARYRATETYALVLGVSFYAFLAAVLGYLLLQVAHASMPPADVLTVFTLCTNLFVALGVMARDVILFDDDLFRIEQMRQLLAEDQAGEEVQSEFVDDTTDQVEACGATTQTDSQEVTQNIASELIPDGEASILSARNVSFSYVASDQVLHDISFDIRPGEVVALVGPNGCGKTTLVKLLLGVFQPTEGQLFLNGCPYSQIPLEELRQQMGAFFQDFYLFHHTIAENVAYGSVEHVDQDEHIRQALEKGGAAHLVQDLPQGMHTLARRRIDRTGVEFSGGEKQLLGTARAYMGDKQVLMFDEPASMLDPLAELAQFQAIRSRVGHATGILVSHRVGFARMADRVIMMEDGRIVEMGTHQQLMEKNGRYASFFQEQAQWYEEAGI